MYGIRCLTLNDERTHDLVVNVCLDHKKEEGEAVPSGFVSGVQHT